MQFLTKRPPTRGGLTVGADRRGLGTRERLNRRASESQIRRDRYEESLDASLSAHGTDF